MLDVSGCNSSHLESGELWRDMYILTRLLMHAVIPVVRELLRRPHTSVVKHIQFYNFFLIELELNLKIVIVFSNGTKMTLCNGLIFFRL